jgi:serine/threonine-protein kinase
VHAHATSGDRRVDGTNAPLPFAAGALIAGKYRLSEIIGKGGMGVVWRAKHEELKSDVAIKFAFIGDPNHDDERVLERFRFEAQVSAQLSQHTPYIIKVFDAGRFRDVPFMVMEYVAGRSLEAVIDADGPLPPERVSAIMQQVCAALSVAHDSGIWHRDIKAANIMVADRSDGRVDVKVADFGVSKTVAQQLDVELPRTTATEMLVGTPMYMSPEQITGAPADGRSDLWSLAVVAYEALTAQQPFDGRTIGELIANIAKEPHTRLPTRSLPRALDKWFARAFAKDATQRFASASDLATSFSEAANARSRRAPWVLALAALLVLAAALVIAGLRETAPDTPTVAATESEAKSTAPIASSAIVPSATSPASAASPEPSVAPIPKATATPKHPPPPVQVVLPKTSPPKPAPDVDPSIIH